MASVHTSAAPVVALVDPRDLIRAALLKSFSEALPGATVIAAANLGDLAGRTTDRLCAVVLHIDHSKTGDGSLSEVVASARAALGGVPLVTLSESADDESLKASIEGGASAHLTTSMALDIAAATIRIVMLGGTCFPAVNADLRRRTPARTDAGGNCGAYVAGERLTRREEEVLRLVGKGTPNKMIAFLLNMSENTVKVHLHRILQKLQINNRTEAALLAHRYLADSARLRAEAPPRMVPHERSRMLGYVRPS